MSTPFLCIALAFALVYVPLVARALAPGAAWAKRAREVYAAGAVAFPGFAAAVFVAHLSQADARRTTVLCIAYVVVRALHIPAATMDLPFMRRALWGGALLIIAGLFLLASVT